MAAMTRPDAAPLAIRKIGRVVPRVTDLARAVEFYTGVLGFKVSDVNLQDMMPGGMVFMRFGADSALRPKEQWDWAHSLEEAIDRPVPGQHAVLADPSLRDAK